MMEAANKKVLIVITCLLMLQACSSGPAVTPYDGADYLARAQTQEKDGIRVTARISKWMNCRAGLFIKDRRQW